MENTSNLATLQAEAHLPLELQARSEGERGGVEYVRRLRVDVERSWPFFSRALAAAGLARSVATVAAALWEAASDSRPITGNREAARDRWEIIEARLAIELRDKGLPLKLAASRAGVTERQIERRTWTDPDLRDRLQAWRREGLAKLHETLHACGIKGSESAISKLLEWSGEPEYTPRLKIQEVDEGEIVRSKAWARLTSRLAGVLCPECRARAAEAVGE